jgi:hypothetical protein
MPQLKTRDYMKMSNIFSVQQFLKLSILLSLLFSAGISVARGPQTTPPLDIEAESNVFTYEHEVFTQRIVFANGNGDSAYIALGTDRHEANDLLIARSGNTHIRQLVSMDIRSWLQTRAHARVGERDGRGIPIPASLLALIENHDAYLDNREQRTSLDGSTDAALDGYRQELNTQITAYDAGLRAFVPTEEQYRDFIHYQFNLRREHLSYLPPTREQSEGGGTLAALAIAMGIQLTVMRTDAFNNLRVTLFVAAPENTPHQTFHLLHTETMDEGVLNVNHFNRLSSANSHDQEVPQAAEAEAELARGTALPECFLPNDLPLLQSPPVIRSTAPRPSVTTTLQQNLRQGIERMTGLGNGISSFFKSL